MLMDCFFLLGSDNQEEQGSILPSSAGTTPLPTRGSTTQPQSLSVLHCKLDWNWQLTWDSHGPRQAPWADIWQPLHT